MPRNDIPFTTLSERKDVPPLLDQVVKLVNDFKDHDAKLNLSVIKDILINTVPKTKELSTVLAVDANKTLAPQDTGILFWEEALKIDKRTDRNPLKILFDKEGYSYFLFRQATLLYEEQAHNFGNLCDKVANQVVMHDEFKKLLREVPKHKGALAAIITLAHVHIIGAGRVEDGFVVTAEIKGTIVDWFKGKGARDHSFGDSQCDMEMLRKADQAFVVVGKTSDRSSSTGEALKKALGEKDFAPQQIRLPKTSFQD